MKYMLDTNICIYAIKKKPESVLKRLRSELDSGICISSVTLAELRFGVEKSLYPERNTVALSQFLVPLNVLPFDDTAAVEYGRICAFLQRKGTPIGTMDMLIAAHAKTVGIPLVTNNTKEFERVPDLLLENWV
ncbi:MAG TPA: VapC toxin family PIN domain ribonuclease [Ruminococcaceae bacterium]|nr:VapC toxin family PIN domain ribonuclease [Oscillospiraceae bacterium]